MKNTTDEMIDDMPLKCWKLWFVAPKRENRHRWVCLCDCGNETEVNISDLKSGKVRSCGCDGYGPTVQNKRYWRNPLRQEKDKISARQTQRYAVLSRRLAREIYRRERMKLTSALRRK